MVRSQSESDSIARVSEVAVVLAPPPTSAHGWSQIRSSALEGYAGVSESTRDAGRCHAILGNNPEGGFSRNMGHHSSTELGNRVSGQQASVVRTDVATRVGIAPEWRGPAIVAFICVGSVLMIFRQTLLALGPELHVEHAGSRIILA